VPVYGYYVFQNPPYMASRQLLIPRIASAGTSFSPLPCQAWHGYGVTNAHRVEIEVGADGLASAPLSGAAAAAPPAGAYILTSTHVGDPLGLTIDLHNGEYRASTENYAYSPGSLPPYLAVRPRALDGYWLGGWPASFGKHISSTLPSPPPASSYASFTTFGYTHMY
jgi:hypothetical protein